jgi:hypothetical protein
LIGIFTGAGKMRLEIGQQGSGPGRSIIFASVPSNNMAARFSGF